MRCVALYMLAGLYIRHTFSDDEVESEPLQDWFVLWLTPQKALKLVCNRPDLMILEMQAHCIAARERDELHLSTCLCWYAAASTHSNRLRALNNRYDWQ